MARIGEVESRFDGKLGNLDNYKVVAADEVLFKFGSAELTPDAKTKIDTLVNSFSEKKRFVVEVQGYTDKSGSTQYNLELSRRRADAVARYLTTAHKMPLWAIHMIGYGQEMPAADNKTRTGRTQNRRVEVRMLTADLSGTPTTSAGNKQEPADTDSPQR
jgi:outer membrane protein OmpA-like peptidoglycan-associated protein